MARVRSSGLQRLVTSNSRLIVYGVAAVGLYVAYKNGSLARLTSRVGSAIGGFIPTGRGTGTTGSAGGGASRSPARSQQPGRVTSPGVSATPTTNSQIIAATPSRSAPIVWGSTPNLPSSSTVPIADAPASSPSRDPWSAAPIRDPDNPNWGGATPQPVRFDIGWQEPAPIRDPDNPSWGGATPQAPVRFDIGWQEPAPIRDPDNPAFAIIDYGPAAAPAAAPIRDPDNAAWSGYMPAPAAVSPRATLDDVYAHYERVYGVQPEFSTAQSILGQGLTYEQIVAANSLGAAPASAAPAAAWAAAPSGGEAWLFESGGSDPDQSPSGFTNYDPAYVDWSGGGGGTALIAA